MDPNHTWEDVAGEYAAQRDNARRERDLLLTMVRDAASHATAVYDANKTRYKPSSAFDALSLGQLYGEKRALDDLLLGMEEMLYGEPDYAVSDTRERCGGQDPKFPGQACPLPKGHAWYGVGCFDEVSG